MRDDAGLLSIVLGNAYDLDTQDWVEDRMRADFRYRVAHPSHVADYLAREEAKMRAMDGVAASLQSAANADDAGEDLSFEAISDVVFGLLQEAENLRRVATSMLAKGLLSVFAVGFSAFIAS